MTDTGRPLRVLHVFNRHRGGGGSDNAWLATIRLQREAGFDVRIFERDSKSLAPGLGGKLKAFADGIYPPDALEDFDRALARHQPDIVNTHELYPLITPFALARAKRAGYPVVQTFYDFRMSCPIATHGKAGRVCTECLDRNEWRAVANDCRANMLESIAFATRAAVHRKADLFRKHVDHFVVLSPFARDWLVERHGVAAERITISGCAIVSPATGVDPAEGKYIGFAGRPVPEKGMAVLASAAAQTGLPVRIAIPEGASFAGDLGSNVTVIETRGPEQLADFYRGARMLVVPSLWFETFAIVAAEALGHGVPVIASDIGALANTVVRDETGLLFPPGDAAALAAAMTRLWNDPDLTRKLGAAGRERTLTAFSEAAHLAHYKDAYSTVLAKTAAP